MKVMQHLTLASLLAFGSAFANVAIAEDISPAKATASDQMTSQQELIAIFFAAAKTGNEEVINEFLKHGFPVDVRNASGFTPLMMATYYGHQNIVNRLLEQGADRCARDNKGNTALMGAMFKLEWAIAKQLRQVDCDANAKKMGQKTAEQFAREFGQEEKYRQLLKK
ncbi:ankyrin repeat domain-containing protein [Acinetobacter sp. YH12086]|uniref:ankyrin repeat domain-containing protein n=1 Tax=Acinetobacter sp. YH12086 TaxID=2601078 RepID=UPI0015D24FFA|nr:ankyrin repeat domain-containing protein [Acinetobacter sp. YH12086]